MGNYKKRHAQDKLYVTQKQWREWGMGHKNTKKQDFKRLPFDCCALSLRPAKKPMITRQGHIFDFINIIPWIKKYGSNPITGDKMTQEDLIAITFHKNTDNEYHCPVLYEKFNEQSHIVCIWQSGHVYCNRAIRELCVKNKSMKDLITEKSFSKDDIIDVQHPLHLEKFNFTTFDYLKKGLDVKSVVKDQDSDLYKGTNGSILATSSIKKQSQEVASTLKEFYKNDKPDEIIKSINNRYHDKQFKPAMSNDAKSHYSTGMVGQALTSTAISRHTVNSTAIRDDREMRNNFVKQKAYVSIFTSHGPLSFELHCDMIPLACENFIELAKRKFFDGTKFHRLIKNFMIQGGCPKGDASGKGGESIFDNKPFKDEFRQSLKFDSRGVLAMANVGPHTNMSQFFILLSPQEHLYRKNTVFGKLVGGHQTLNEIENVKVDTKTEKPLEDVFIISVEIYVDPFEQANQKIAKIKENEYNEANRLKIISDRKIEKQKERLEAIARAKDRGLSLEELRIIEKEEAIKNKPKGVGRYLPKKDSPPKPKEKKSIEPKPLGNEGWENYEDFTASNIEIEKDKKLNIKTLKNQSKKEAMLERVSKKKPVVTVARPVETMKKLMKARQTSKKNSFNFSSW